MSSPVKSGLGFGVQKVRDLEPVSVYSGSADTFLTMIAIAPRHDVAVAVSANAAHPGAEGAVKKVLVDLLAEHARQNFPPGPPVPKTR